MRRALAIAGGIVLATALTHVQPAAAVAPIDLSATEGSATNAAPSVGNGLLTKTVTYTSYDALNGDESTGLTTTSTKTMSCDPSASGDSSTWTDDAAYSTWASGPITGTFYVVDYGKLNASRKSTGEYRYHVLACMFGNARTTSGRLIRAGAGMVVYNATSPSTAKLMANPVWDTYIGDSKSNVTLDMKATSNNFSVGVAVGMSKSSGHLEGNFGGRAPQSLPMDSKSIVNTVHAWWQNDCPYGVSCGVTSTRAAVAEGVYGFGMSTERTYWRSIQAFGQHT